MRRFKAEITKELIVELDEKFFNERFNEHYSRYFSDVYSLECHVENIAYVYNNFGFTNIEGYGYPLVNGKRNWSHANNESVVYNTAINIIDKDDIEIYCYE